MNDFFVSCAVILAIVILLPFVRIARGPTIFDRLLAVGTIGSKTIALVCLIGIIYGRFDMFVDIALAYAILNFIGTLAVAKYFTRASKGRPS